MATRKKKERNEAAYLAPFGAYLREIRQRKGLSLAEVESLSERSTDPVNKGYLSRVENGQQSIAFSKLITIARIYDCPPGALVDRLELDMEAASVEVPEFDSMEAMYRWIRPRNQAGEFIAAYAGIRDFRFTLSDDDRRQRLTLSLSTPSILVGRFDFVEYELRALATQDAQLSLANLSFLHERLGTLFLRKREFAQADSQFTSALELAVEANDTERVFHTQFSIASMLRDQNKPQEALLWAQRAHESAKELDPVLRSKVMSTIAGCYIRLRRFAAARRAILASEKLLPETGSKPSKAYLRVLRGEIAKAEGDITKARQYHQQALQMLRSHRKHRIRYYAELNLLEIAIDTQDAPAIRAIKRRISRMLPWFPKEAEFQDKLANLQSRLQ